MTYDYIAAFHEGHTYNRRVAKYLRSRGVKCYAPDLQIAQSNEERAIMTRTEKDIIIEGIDEILEVKSSSREFSDVPADYPYPTLIVDTVDSYEKKEKKPLAYVLVSKDTDAMITVGGSSKPRWFSRKFYDSKQCLWDNFYLANKSDIKHIEDLVQYLLRRQSQSR